jgi:hypothetical protein
VTKKQQLRMAIKQGSGSFEKIRRKPPKFDPTVDKRNSNKNKLKESFGGESA